MDLKLIERTIVEHFPEAKIIVQPNSYKGINLKVIDEAFAEITDRESYMDQILQKIGISLIGTDDIAFYEFLTPEEDELYGTDMKSLQPEDLPFWANVIDNSKEVLSPQYREDNTLNKPPIVTFYSFKGGVGRSTALVATALQLANKGRRVILVDMDLEAPGLPELLGVELETEYEKSGLVRLLHDIEIGKEVDLRNYLCEVMENLHLIPAGEMNPQYLRYLSYVNPARYYRLENNPVTIFFEKVRELEPQPDIIIVDARTGLTDISAPLLFHLSDLTMVVFYPHPQAKRGIELLTEGVLKRRNINEFTNELRFVMSMIPASDKTTKQIQNRGIEWAKDYLDKISRYSKKNIGISVEDVISTIYYQEQIAYATSMNDEKYIQAYEQIAEWADNMLDVDTDQYVTNILSSSSKKELLESMQIQTGIAEHQENLPEIFVQTSDYQKAKDNKINLIIGRKGTGKSAIFRMLLEENKGQAVVIRHSRPASDQLDLNKNDFKEIEDVLPEKNWDIFWAVYVLIQIVRKNRELIDLINDDEVKGYVLSVVNHNDKMAFLNGFEKIIKSKFLIQKLINIFDKINLNLDGELILLWDGLDRDFGIEVEQIRRRDRIIVGLLDFWNLTSQMHNFIFKIFLRHDIWDKLKFNNKSHFYGRIVKLSWRNMFEYYKTLLKQLYAVDVLKDYFKKKYLEFEGKNLPEQVDNWSDEHVIFVFNLLVSERMRGGRTVFTRNWVWSRLADGKKDHSPRFLFQLFDKAKDLEVIENKRNPYDRSLIRPRMLIDSLEEVSRSAVESLIEEYEELEEFTEQLKSKMIVPFEIKLLNQDSNEQKDLIDLALEVGLIAPYDSTADGDIFRITVPDLYLKGLGMSRRGQA